MYLPESMEELRSVAKAKTPHLGCWLVALGNSRIPKKLRAGKVLDDKSGNFQGEWCHS